MPAKPKLRLSSTAMALVEDVQKLGSLNAARQAHPEMSDDEVAAIIAELKQAIAATLGGVPVKKSLAGKRKKNSLPGDAYQLKITLRGSKPPIWRRVIVPAEIRLDRLHEVIQGAMGWSDCHLHLFDIDGTQFQGPSPDGYVDEDSDFEDASQYRLSDVVMREKSKFRYEYDFGDGWDHLILVEKIIPASDKPTTMICIAGKGRCPFEDSGGLWGYYEKLRILANPNDPEHEEIKDWVGGDIDPNEFEIEAANMQLAMIQPI